MMMTQHKGASIWTVVLAGFLFCGVVPNDSWADVCGYTPPNVSQLHGTVLDASNKPIHEVVVSLMKGEEILRITTTNEAGEFNLGPLPDGKYQVDVSAKGFNHARYAVILGQQTRHWKKLIRIKLSVGIDQCKGTLEVVENSNTRH